MEKTENPLGTGVYRVVKAAGGVSKLARRLGTSRAAIYMWLKNGHVSPGRAVQLAHLYKVDRDSLMDQRMLALLKGTTEEVLDSGALAYQPQIGKVK